MRDAALSDHPRDRRRDRRLATSSSRIDPEDGRMVVIEMNPRVSRTLGARLQGDRLSDRQDRGASSPSAIAGRDSERHHPRDAGLLRADHRLRGDQDSRFAFEKFPGATPTLDTADEVGGRGDGDRAAPSRNRCRRRCARWKPARGASDRRSARCRRGLIADELEQIRDGSASRPPAPVRVADAFRAGVAVEEIHELTGIDPWFLEQSQADRRAEERCVAGRGLAAIADRAPRGRSGMGFSDRRIGRAHRHRPRSTCARHAQGAGCRRRSTSPSIPAPRSSRPSRPISIRPTRTSDEAPPTNAKKVMILGGGPNRIGQGIEFDYCCVHAVLRAARSRASRPIMVNCNPETVSTDYDTSDRLYFEPLTLEDVIEHLRARAARRRDRAVRRADAA